MNFLRKFMYGRYGSDQLNIALIICSVVLMILLRIVSALTGFIWIVYLDWLPIFWALFRMLSKNIQKRRIENEKFLKFWQPVQSRMKYSAEKFRMRKTYKYFNCPSCGAHLRVPRQGGKTLSVNCSKCGHRFSKKA